MIYVPGLFGDRLVILRLDKQAPDLLHLAKLKVGSRLTHGWPKTNRHFAADLSLDQTPVNQRHSGPSTSLILPTTAQRVHTYMCVVVYLRWRHCMGVRTY